MFSCVFVLFEVMNWLFWIPLRTVNNTKTQENVSVCTGLSVLNILSRSRNELSVGGIVIIIFYLGYLW